MNFLVMLLVATAITALCLLGMAVGVLLRGRCFASCGCATITFNGEKIDCPGHVDPKGDGSRCSRSGAICENAGTCGT